MKNKPVPFFERFANRVTRVTGKPATFIVACIVILLWGVTGPIFGFSDTWQLIINTSTTIITFLMVFAIQHAQNKDTAAVQLKLNELIAASKGSSNRLIDVEDLSADELDVLKSFYIKLAELAKKERDIHQSHSIDEAKASHTKKESNK